MPNPTFGANSGWTKPRWPTLSSERSRSGQLVVYFQVGTDGTLTELYGCGTRVNGMPDVSETDGELAERYPQLIEDIRKAVDGKPVYFSSCGLHADQPWAFDVFLMPSDADGGAVGLVVDTTAHRRMWSDLERLFDLSLDMMCIAGTDGYFKWVNPAFERVLGYSAAALETMPFLDFVHPDDRPATIAKMEHLAAGQPTVTFANRYRHKNGGHRWLEWNAMPVPQEGVIYAVARDITAQKLSEQHAQDLKQLLHVTERINSGVRLEEVLDSVYDGLRDGITFNRVGVALIDKAQDMVVTRWVRCDRDIRLGVGAATRLEGSSLQAIASDCEVRVINDLQTYLAAHPDSRTTRLLIDEGMRSSMTCPLVIDGATIGFIFFNSVEPDTYTARHVNFFWQVAGQLSVMVERGRLYSELAAKNETIECQHNAMLRDLKLAQGLQRRLSPDVPPSLPEMETSYLYEPADQVGGDIVDMFRVSDHQMLFLLGDAMGHGVRAALVMSLTKALFHTEARQHPEPEHVVTRMNNALCQMLDGEFVTVACALVDTATRTVDVVLAGHHPPIQFHIGIQTWAPVPQLLYCMPLGFAPDEVYVNLRTTMAQGDMLLFFTDGLVEAANRDHKMYGTGRLIATLSQMRDTSTDEVLSTVRSDVLRHCDGRALDDDMSMLAIRML